LRGRLHGLCPWRGRRKPLVVNRRVRNAKAEGSIPFRSTLKELIIKTMRRRVFFSL